MTAPRRPVLGLRQGRRFVAVRQADILYATSRGGLVTVYTVDGREAWSPLSLTGLSARLSPRRFLRLDASHVVNVE